MGDRYLAKDVKGIVKYQSSEGLGKNNNRLWTEV